MCWLSEGMAYLAPLSIDDLRVDWVFIDFNRQCVVSTFFWPPYSDNYH